MSDSKSETVNDQNQPRAASGNDPGAPEPITALAASALRWRCSPDMFPFDSTANVEPIVGVVGQETAMESLRFGLEIAATGQNIFVRGLAGTGRMTLLRRLLQEIRPSCPEANDRCYVHNFTQPLRPILLTLPRARGREFQRRLDKLADLIRDKLGKALTQNSMLNARRAALERATEQQIEAVVKPFEKALKEASLAMMTVQAGGAMHSALFPLVDDKPLPPEEYESLRAQGKISDEDDALFRQRRDKFREQLAEINAKVRTLQSTFEESLQKLYETEVRLVLHEDTCSIEKTFPFAGVAEFLKSIVDDVAKHRLASLAADDDDDGEPEIDFTRLYRVNVVSDNPEGTACAIVIENAPTLMNLLGVIDREMSHAGEPGRADHLTIRAGSLFQADGGYLIMEARDLLGEPGAWKVLVRTLRTGRLEIVPPELGAMMWPGVSIKPEPIDINVKVILLGDGEIYHMLDEFDPDFPNLFKVLADFDSVIERTDEGIGKYAGVLARLVRDEGLLDFDRTGVAALLEHSARIASSRNKLTTRFGRLADLAREASFLARKVKSTFVTDEHVRQSVRRSKARAALPSRRFREYLANGIIKVMTRGTAIGQINGLAVLQAGPLTYGFPARITATIGPGTAGVINIEREAALSGSIHTKGFFILGGLLRTLLKTNHPLAFSASIAFEQSYGGIDGDSASGAEICCLLSALTEAPIRQDLAITGAIDQVGNILAIGAVNEKIEGFFDVCNDAGLTGTQGVILPKSNLGDLMLRHDVVAACEQGRFHVYAVATVHEAITLLTGMPAGTKNSAGRYEKGTLLATAVDQARTYWRQAAKAFAMDHGLEDDRGGYDADADDDDADDGPAAA